MPETQVKPSEGAVASKELAAEIERRGNGRGAVARPTQKEVDEGAAGTERIPPHLLPRGVKPKAASEAR